MKILTAFLTSSKCKSPVALHLGTFALLLFPLLLSGQDKKAPARDSTSTYLLSDSVQISKGKKVISIATYAAKFNPRKALLYSAVLPGLGQIYNRKYWKLPIVYGGFIAGGYAIKVYQDQYAQYRSDLFVILDKKSINPSKIYLSPDLGLTEAQLRTITNRARRQRDYLIILTGVWYVLQMVDAHVDAHLKEFDVNPQLKARLEPMMERDMLIGTNTGVALKLRF